MCLVLKGGNCLQHVYQDITTCSTFLYVLNSTLGHFHLKIVIFCLIKFPLFQRLSKKIEVGFKHNDMMITGLEIMAAWLPVKMTGQVKFSSLMPRFWPVKYINM